MLRRIFVSSAVLSVLLVLGGCGDKAAHCTGRSGSAGHLISNESLTGCSDNKARDIRCARGREEAPFSCSCVEGGTPGKTFQRKEILPNNTEDVTKLAIQECGWTLK